MLNTKFFVSLQGLHEKVVCFDTFWCHKKPKAGHFIPTNLITINSKNGINTNEKKNPTNNIVW